MKKILNTLLNRIVIVAILILIQIILLISIIWRFNQYFVYFYYFTVLLSDIFLIVILNDDFSKPGYKLAWIATILIIPIFGVLFYLIFGYNHRNFKQAEHIHMIEDRLSKPNPEVMEEIKEKDKRAYNQSCYIRDYAGYSPFKNTYSEYFPLGEDFFEALKIELKKAKRYIFMEYFIIQPGVMWDELLEILVQKVSEGVDVRVIYDDIGCCFTLPPHYNRTLTEKGIKTHIYSPFVPVLSSSFNNRDHRKITVIDGHTGFTGGINLADEYINAYPKHGHWKDTAIMLKGEGVAGFTKIFLSLWSYLDKSEEDFTKFDTDFSEVKDYKASGYVQPFCDTPMDKESVGETIYLNLISKAQEYLYINTPYLIIDSSMIMALCNAAKSGVDVRIVTPHQADKWYVHAVTRSHYEILMRAGVKIYEYEPGFIHAKSFLVDGKYGVVGTINLDYRSLYLHSECGVWMYATDTINVLLEDYKSTLEKCVLISLEEYSRTPKPVKLGRMILRVFSPLM